LHHLRCSKQIYHH